MWMPLGVSFGGSFAYHVVAWVWEGVRSADVLAALGWRAPGRWEWVVQPSMGYVGQGILMGPRVALSMLGGAVTGWAMLGPMARRLGWVSAWRGVG